MNAQRSLTITSADELTEVPARHRDRGILAILSTPTAEDVADFFEPVDPRDCTLVTYYVEGEYSSAVTLNTPRGDVAASERCMTSVKRHLVRLRVEAAALECDGSNRSTLAWPINRHGEPLRKSNNGYTAQAGSKPGTLLVFRFGKRKGLYRIGERDTTCVYLTLIRKL